MTRRNEISVETENTPQSDATPNVNIENLGDESQILADQDVTNNMDVTRTDENLGARSSSLDSLENESQDFMRGEIDVKEQMDRTSELLSNSIHGIQEANGEFDMQSELISSFQNTPGGIEEVIMKTDEFLAHQEKPKTSENLKF